MRFLLATIVPSFLLPTALAQECFRAWQIVGDERGIVMSMLPFAGGASQRLFVGGLSLSRPAVSQHSIAIWDGAAWASAAGAPFQGCYVIRELEWNGTATVFAGGSLGLYRWDGSTFVHIPGNLGSVTSLARYDDGAGAAIFLMNTSGRIYRWTGSGTPTQIALASPAGWLPNAMEVFDDGSGAALYVGAFFRSIAQPDGSNPVAANKVARWNGSTWSPVGMGMSGATGGPNEALVESFAVFDDGGGPALYASGGFEMADGNPVSSIARWSGSGWTAVGGATSEQHEISSLAILDRGAGRALYACGTLTDFAGLGATNVVKWDGVSWSVPPFAGPANGPVISLMSESGPGSAGELYASGQFRDQSGVQVSAIARWTCVCPDLDADGTVGLQDLSNLLAEFGNAETATFADGDISGDGAVDLTDLSGLLSNFGRECP